MALYGYVEGRDDGLGVPDNVILRCDCIDRCELEIERCKGDHIVDDVTGKTFKEPDEYYFIFKTKARYNNIGMFEALKIKLKKIWYVIIGKDYTYYDIEVGEQSMEKFVDALKKLIK